MAEITNDARLREVLQALSLTDQRSVGASFIHLVISVTDDERIEYATRVKRSDVL